MSQSEYENPSRTLRKGDKGSDVLGLAKAVNRIFSNNDLGRRVESSNTVSNDLITKSGLAAQMVGVPKENVKNAQKKDKSHRRLDVRLQDLVRYGDKRSDKQKEQGRKFTKKYKADIEKEKAKDDPNVINQYFKVSDFDCHDGSKVPAKRVDDLKRHVINVLTKLREDSGAAVYINSAYRPTAYNKSIGGASASQHIYDSQTGTATDIVSAKWSVSQVHSYLDKFADGLGRYSSFNHVDSRGYRSRWDG